MNGEASSGSPAPPLTLADLGALPAAVNVETAARAVGISKSAAYQAIADGTFPARTIKIGKRLKVITASLVSLLGNDETARSA